LGDKALPYVQPLMTHERPEVAYAAARAAAFLKDPSAVEVLIKMAGTKDHPFQINAVQTLGQLSTTQQITRALRNLLASESALVRIEAYEILARDHDSSVWSKVIDERFVLDIVHAPGAPLVYATRRGVPRVAVFGERLAVRTPVTFTALNNQFSITSDDPRPVLKLFYRGKEMREPVTVLSNPDVAEMVARLGGEPRDAKQRLSFSYGDILGILQSLADSGRFYDVPQGKPAVQAAIVLQDVGGQNELIAAHAPTDVPTDGGLPDLIPAEQNKHPLNDGAATGARPQ
jgi:hypothetical protein